MKVSSSNFFFIVYIEDGEIQTWSGFNLSTKIGVLLLDCPN